MKNKILGLLSLAALCLSALPIPAQQYEPRATLVSGGIVRSGFDDGGTVAPYQSNYTAITVTKYEDLYLYLTASPSNTSSGQMKVVFSIGPDGSSFANQGSNGTNYFTLSVGTAGTLINWGTNITVGSAGYIKFGIIGATNSVLTNVTLKAYTKPDRHG